MKNSKDQKLFEWGIIICIVLIVIITKYLIFNCMILCGDWYDG